MEEYVVKTYPSDFLFHLDPMDPMEEHISVRDPLDFQEIQSNLQDIFSAPLDFYFYTSLSIFLLICMPLGFLSSVWGVRG